MSSDLPFHKSFLEEPSNTKYPSGAPSYRVEVLGSRDKAVQLSIAKPHVKNILKDLLAEIKGFKSQIIFHVTFPKEIDNGKIKYSRQIYLSSMNQTVIIDLTID